MGKAEQIEGWDGPMAALIEEGQEPFYANLGLRKLIHDALESLGVGVRDRRTMIHTAKIDEVIFPKSVSSEDRMWPGFVEVPTELASSDAKQRVGELAASGCVALSDKAAMFAVGGESDGGTVFIGRRALEDSIV